VVRGWDTLGLDVLDFGVLGGCIVDIGGFAFGCAATFARDGGVSAGEGVATGAVTGAVGAALACDDGATAVVAF
jgi:hypothetical protein